MKKLVLIGGILGLLLVLASCTSCAHIDTKLVKVDFNKHSDWKDVADKRGKFAIRNDGVTEITPEQQFYIIKGTLSSKGKSREVRLCVDTGTQQNLISTSIIEFFDGAENSGHHFMLSGTYVESPQKSSYGYYFEKFEADGFEMEDILFQDICFPNLGFTSDGETVDGLIGMDILRRAPFKFSIADKQLVFYNDSKSFTNGNTVSLVKKKLPYKLCVKFKLPNGKKCEADLDTGALLSYIPPKKFKSLKKYMTCFVELDYPTWTEVTTCLNDVEFGGEKIPLLPVRANVVKKSIDFSNTLSLGLLAFRNFDLYVDVQNAKMTVIRRDYDYPKKFTMSDIVSDSVDYVMMGATISDSRQQNYRDFSDAGKYFITMVSYVDGIPTYPNIKLEDEVLEINGISPAQIDWDNWYDIKEAVLLLSRDGKEFTERIYRHEFIFGPEF